MVRVIFEERFREFFSKIKDNLIKIKIFKQIKKIKNSPEVGKPMKYMRKGSRELYINPFRLSYIYIKEEDKVYITNLYHKDKQ